MQSEISNTNSESTLYGLIGYPLSHTFSPAYFNEKFAREGIQTRYEAFPIEKIEHLPALLKQHPQLHGLNVTTPYKQAVIPYLDVISEDAESIGAVNCIAIKNGHRSGYNTDWLGLRDSLQPLLRPHHTTALVLGNGGASQGIKYALNTMGIAYRTVARTKEKGDYLYEEITPSIIDQHTIIINTTTLGTHGIGCPALPYAALSDRHLLYDLVYNPSVTLFLAMGLEYGASIKNGEEMLHLQAEASWAIWQQQ